jgi:hypothetical protein
VAALEFPLSAALFGFAMLLFTLLYGSFGGVFCKKIKE